jgi:hypothetical protein
MDSAIWLPLLSGFTGAIIGASASITTVIIQSRKEDRREIARLAAELAKNDHAATIDIAKSNKRNVAITPLPIFISYYTDLMNTIDRGELSPQRYVELRQKHERLLEAIDAEQKPAGER